MERSFRLDAPLHCAVDEQPYLRKLYDEVKPAAIMAWAADQLRDVRLMVEDVRSRLRENAIISAFERAADGRWRVTKVVQRLHDLAIYATSADGAKNQVVQTAPEWGDHIEQAAAAGRQMVAASTAAAANERNIAALPPQPTPGGARMPTPKLSRLASLPGAFEKLFHGLEARSEGLLNRLHGTDARADHVFAKADDRLKTVAHAALDGVDKYLDQLEVATNGGPLDGSDGQSQG